MENVRKRIRIVLVGTARSHAWQTSKPGFKRFSIFSKNLVGVEVQQPSITLDKPIYAGFTVLELSKLLMFNFHYNIFKPNVPNSTLCFTDTDSLVYHVRGSNIYDTISSMGQHFDFSNFPETSPYHNKINQAVIGKMKDECKGQPISEFVGLRAKNYSLLLNGDIQKQAAAGINRDVAKKYLKHNNLK